MSKQSKIVLAIFAVLFSSIGIWYEVWFTNPVVILPAEKLPSPNAYDAIVRACTYVRDPDAISALGKAKRLPSAPLSLTRIESELVSNNKLSMAMVRVALGESYIFPRADATRQNYTVLKDFRCFTNLFELEGIQNAAARNYAGAMNSNLDAFQLSLMAPHSCQLIGGLNSCACQFMALQTAWRYVDHLNGVDARIAAQRLETLRIERIPLSQTMVSEFSGMQPIILTEMQQRDYPWHFGDSDSRTRDPNSYASIMMGLMMLRHSKVRVNADLTLMLNDMSKRGDTPYQTQRSLVPTKLPDDYICTILAPSYSKAKLKWIETDADSCLLELSLALRAYRTDHATYPTSLGSLVPHYIAVVPLDPFALNRPPIYKTTGDSYRLYSVGPDGKDDGGKPFISTKAQSSNDHLVDGSVGDIVAGPNFRL